MFSFFKRRPAAGDENAQQVAQAPVPPPVPPRVSAQQAVRSREAANMAVPNAQVSRAKEQVIHVVFSIDISGSMAAHSDAFDREAGPDAPKINRFEAAKRDAIRYMRQLQVSDRVSACDVLLFGERLHEYRNVTTVKRLQEILDAVTDFEGATRTDLALKRANELFLEDCKAAEAQNWPDDRASFFNIVMTDGDPNVRGLTSAQAQQAVAQLIVEGTEAMRRDEDRTTLIQQYGFSEYYEGSPVSRFLAFLDDELEELTIAYFKKRFPDTTEDDINYIYDACDTGRQCDTWAQKDPEGVDRNAFWDDDVEKMFEIALCD